MINVYQISEYEWWAGESFDACLAEARRVTGEPYEEAEFMYGAPENLGMFGLSDDLDARYVLQGMIDAGETFPCLFAGIE